MKRLGPVSLRAFNTFAVDAQARHIVQLESPADIDRLAEPGFDPATDLVLGGGSNILFVDDVPGTLFLVRIRGREVLHDDRDGVLVEAGAGETWHDLVSWALDRGYCGLENLSLIPGLVGAAPMQNIGAYGAELATVLDSVSVLEWGSGKTLRIPAADCGFGYRDSRFRSTDAHRFLVLSCRLRLSRRFEPILDYAGLRGELSDMGIVTPTPRDISQAVIRLRTRKLPDPRLIGNAGSFFKNPELTNEQAAALTSSHHELPVFRITDRKVRVSAAWMIEQCGWKGHRRGDAGVSGQHALVLVNHGVARGRQIWALAEDISDSVEERFGIRLEPEPRIYRKD